MTKFSWHAKSQGTDIRDAPASQLGWTIARLLRELYPDIRLRQPVREHPLLESVTLASLLDDPVTLDAFLDEFASLPQCGSTQVSRLRTVLVSELRGFSQKAKTNSKKIVENGVDNDVLAWQDDPDTTDYFDSIPVTVPAGPFTAALTDSGELRLKTFSQALLEITQLSLEADTNLLEIFLAHMQPDDRSSFKEAAQSALRASSTLSWNGKFKTGSGWRYMSITLHPPWQETAHQIWTGILQDLTEIKGLQKRFETVLDAAQAYTWRRDMRLRVSQFGKRWAKFARHDDGRTSLTYEEWLALVHPDDAPRIKAQIVPLERGEVRHETLLYRRQLGDGSWVWLRVHAGISEEDEDGTPLALSGVTFDITAEMQMHEQSAQDQRNLRNELERTQAALERTAYDLTENIPIGTYTMLLEPGAEIARFGFMSRQFLEITGLSPDQARTDPYRAFACVHPDDYSIWLRKNIHAFTYKLPFREETRLLVDGQIRWVLAESVPRSTEDGTWIWEGVIHDITSQKMAERVLQEANKKILEAMHEKLRQDKDI